MNHFCRQASQLLSDHYERPLSSSEKIRLRLHLLICGMCRNYGSSLAFMHTLMTKLRETEDDYPPLPEAVRLRILQRLESERGSA